MSPVLNDVTTSEMPDRSLDFNGQQLELTSGQREPLQVAGGAMPVNENDDAASPVEHFLYALVHAPSVGA